MFFVQVRPLLSPSWLMSSETALRHRGCKMWKYRGSQLLDATPELARKKCSVIALVAWCGTLPHLAFIVVTGVVCNALTSLCWSFGFQRVLFVAGGKAGWPRRPHRPLSWRRHERFTSFHLWCCRDLLGCWLFLLHAHASKPGLFPSNGWSLSDWVVTTNGEGKTEPRWWQAQLDAWVRGALWRVLPRARGKTHQNCIKAVIFNLTSGIPRPDGKLR